MVDQFGPLRNRRGKGVLADHVEVHRSHDHAPAGEVFSQVGGLLVVVIDEGRSVESAVGPDHQREGRAGSQGCALTFESGTSVEMALHLIPSTIDRTDVFKVVCRTVNAMIGLVDLNLLLPQSLTDQGGFKGRRITLRDLPSMLE